MATHATRDVFISESNEKDATLVLTFANEADRSKFAAQPPRYAEVIEQTNGSGERPYRHLKVHPVDAATSVLSLTASSTATLWTS